MIFRDRAEAGAALADALLKWRGSNPLVVAIPRGAVPMGSIIAQRLEGELDLVLVRKLHAPGNPEFAIGAVDETGWTYIAEHAAASGALREYIDGEIAAETATIRRRRALYTPGREPVSATGRVVIVVDDGLATGATMIAALHAPRARAPSGWCARPPSPRRMRWKWCGLYADEIACLAAPENFYAVGQFYRDVPQVGDDEVVALLQSRAAATVRGT
jgi:predicted phosphoribosyltransferase